jgi:hypothetical protein
MRKCTFLEFYANILTFYGKLQMEKDMEDLKRQRDLAQCQLDLERRANKVQKVFGMIITH